MLLSVRFDLRHARFWHRDLLDRLARRADVTLAIEPVDADGESATANGLLRLEGLIRSRSLNGTLVAPAPSTLFDEFPRQARETADLTLDLSGKGQDRGRVWRLFVNGIAGEAALLPTIVRGGSPVIAIRDGDVALASGRVGTESKGMLLESFADALARTTTLIEAALSGRAPSITDSGSAALSQSRTLTAAEAARAAAAVLAERAMRRATRLFYRTPHWRVGWRKLDGPDLYDLGRHPEGGWHDLPDDGTRFYADPFAIVQDGKTVLFVEDYPHATGKGMIAAVEFGPDGPLARPEPVLERPYHLSYPFVFAEDGDTWMVPESCAAASIDLYRAARFPGGWVKEATLVPDVEASDATLYHADDQWWLFATVKDGGSYSDALHLWSAPDFRGPWSPHPRNPVLIDIASARPAGRLVRRDGALFRPVQDCRNGYGAALGIARVDRLDHEGFSQTVEAVVSPGRPWPGQCLHTLNAAGDFEFIDGTGWARRTWAH